MLKQNNSNKKRTKQWYWLAIPALGGRESPGPTGQQAWPNHCYPGSFLSVHLSPVRSGQFCRKHR